ncbi:MAG TPA: lamin tail domain-containing protein, partial [Planctomycetota bacterium]|nr:lamin tail domain-containing protein [Planctomycetota bacterium]
IELENDGSETLDVSGYGLSDDPGKLSKWALPSGTTIAPRSLLVVEASDLGASTLSSSVVYLSTPSADRVLDALSLRDGVNVPGEEPIAYGRPPGELRPCVLLARPTPGVPNVRELESDLVIHEIHYRSLADDPSDELIELRNIGAEKRSLAGMRLRGGIDFDFTTEHEIPAGGFLVVAKDPSRTASRYGLKAELVSGPFEGRLANRSEEIRIEDALGRTIDVVAYADRSPWPSEADGGGSTLELLHPRLDNRFAGAWRASDESRRGEWQTISYSLELRTFRNMSATSFQLILLDAGECWVDDLRVTHESGELVVGETFAFENPAWRAFGTHEGSGRVTVGSGAANPYYRVVSTGRGNSRHNYVSLDLDGALREGSSYTVSFRARWISGSPLLLSRTAGQGLARTHTLSAARASGTPLDLNSRRAAAPSPVVGTPRQTPIVPSTGESVRIVVPITSTTNIEKAVVRFRRENEPEW